MKTKTDNPGNTFNIFVDLLAQVSKVCSVKSIAIHCLVLPEQVEKWLKGELPPKSMTPAINIALRTLLKYHDSGTKTKKGNKGVEGPA